MKKFRKLLALLSLIGLIFLFLAGCTPPPAPVSIENEAPVDTADTAAIKQMNSVVAPMRAYPTFNTILPI